MYNERDHDVRYCTYLPVFRIVRIRIQHFRLNTDPDPDPIRFEGFMTKNLKN
jgi:hypothetical protein